MKLGSSTRSTGAPHRRHAAAPADAGNGGRLGTELTLLPVAWSFGMLGTGAQSSQARPAP